MVRRLADVGNPIRGFDIIHRLGGVFAHQPQEVDVQVIGFNHRRGVNNDLRLPFFPDNANPLGGNLPNFNYAHNGYNNGGARGGGTPKPPHVAPPPPREGFTRATGEDLAFVCPNCEEELKYDPDEGFGEHGKKSGSQPPAKKPRSRRDQEEHYFWAVKECGHVYCRNCYEHRKAPSKTAPSKLPQYNFKTSPTNNRKVLCAVDGCQVDLTNKTAWLGLFL
ncbi:hypothetical protein B0T17DRAFT_501429 [Bombardia bombarda]|uniref:Cell cycle control protein n=1 Tax=Bombardia bombarda TaxID=252184 RepID=A0AA39WA93_9PEZI|nr:hypothetical protein B0T17DRAFT_501429 [Bombardia bombarda]